MIAMLLALAVSAPSTITIEVACSGGLRPLVRRAYLTGDGNVRLVRTVYHPADATGHVDPDKVLRLSVRLDAAGFDRLASPKPKFHVYDGVTCMIGRRTATGYHEIIFDPGADMAGRHKAAFGVVDAVMHDAFAIADTILPAPVTNAGGSTAPDTPADPPVAGTPTQIDPDAREK